MPEISFRAFGRERTSRMVEVVGNGARLGRRFAGDQESDTNEKDGKRKAASAITGREVPFQINSG